MRKIHEGPKEMGEWALWVCSQHTTLNLEIQILSSDHVIFLWGLVELNLKKKSVSDLSCYFLHGICLSVAEGLQAGY